MKKHLWKIILISFFIIIAVIVGFFYLTSTSNAINSEQDFIKGPHHGRLLEKEGFQVEVTIFEPEGIPPRFRVFFYKNGKPIMPSDVSFEMELQRINRIEKIPFKQEADYLESTVEASEPHSFKIKIIATYKDKTYDWEYESYEGRLIFTPETMNANGIKMEKAGPINLEITLDVMGKIIPNDESTVYINPRFSGIVKNVNKKLGDHVKKGEILAVIESNESLRDFEVRSEINGMIIKKNINLGMYLSEQDNIFVISDLSSVWADFNLYSQDVINVHVGDPILIKSLDGNFKQQSIISYISPIGDEETQSIVARAIIANPHDHWKPGLFISGEITVENISVGVAVKGAALQSFRDWDVVFISADDQFEVAPVQTGRKNKEWVEITSGLNAGDCYVSDNSFILKADLEKSGATHEH